MARKKATTQKENCQNQFKQSMQHKTTAGHLKFPQMRGGKNKKINVQIHIIYTIVNKNNQKEEKKNDHKLKQDYHQKVWNNCKDTLNAFKGKPRDHRDLKWPQRQARQLQSLCKNHVSQRLMVLSYKSQLEV